MLADGLGQRLQERLARGRAAATARMGSANGASDVVVRRKTGATVQDETTGLQVPEWGDVTALVPFRLGGAQQGSSGTRTVSAGGVEVQVATRIGHFVWDTAGLQDGDLIDVVAGGHVGEAWQIVEADGADQQTALRLPVVRAQRPKEWP